MSDDRHAEQGKKPRGKLLGSAALVVAMALTFAAAAPANPAYAWPWSSHVHVSGIVFCGPFAAKSVTIRAQNGESHSAAANPVGAYGMDFENVPGNGTAATADVLCGFFGGDYSKSVGSITRPLVGDWQFITINR